MVLEFAHLESLGYFKTLCNIFCYSKFHLDGFIFANQFSFVSLQQNSPFDVMSGNFKS